MHDVRTHVHLHIAQIKLENTKKTHVHLLDKKMLQQSFNLIEKNMTVIFNTAQ